MNGKRASLEIIAPSVEEAVARGLSDLGLSEEAVEVEVLDLGSRGLFGLGSRQARVRLTIKAGQDSERTTGMETSSASALEQAALDEILSRPLETPVEEQGSQTTTESSGEVDVLPSAMEEMDEGDIAVHLARETVEELLACMKVHAQVTAHFGEPDDERSRVPLLVDINGDDLSILIGPKAETLNALQYITHLIIGKELGRSVPLVVDVEGYRARRAGQIRQLARRMADQAVSTGRRQILEPMPANERRLVHIELRQHPDVTTESVGEDPRRKVTIIPK